MDSSGQPSRRAAQRRRGRRLRAAWRHEQQVIAQALTAFTHHSAPRGQKKARAVEEESQVHYTAEVRKTHPPQPVLFSLYEGEPGGLPACFAPMVQILDRPVPQTVEQLPDVLQFFDSLIRDPEQVIEVPKILPEDVSMRTPVRDTQLAGQLVEVPTIVSYSWLQLSMEQNVDIPVPGRGGRIARLQGFPLNRVSTALHVSQERISERIVNQIVDGLQDFRPGQSSSSSLHFPAGVPEVLG